MANLRSFNERLDESRICRYEDERLPFLLELNPDGSDIPNGAGVRHRLQPNVTEVGSERPIGPQAVQAQTLTLPGPTVMPRHCVIAFTENIVTLTPCSRDAHTYVNNQRIHQTTILQVHLSFLQLEYDRLCNF